MGLTLVLGGARSGKSRLAESLAAASGAEVRYVATADEADPGMAERVRAHRARRPPSWPVIVAGPDLAAAALGGAEGRCVLVDGLGVWLAVRLHAAGALADSCPAEEAERGCAALRDQVARLARAAAERPAPTIVVCEEAGLGVLPASAGSRRWVDLVGECAQILARRAERALLVVAGRALELPGPAPPAPPQPDRVHGDRLLAPGLADHAVNVLAGGPPDWLRAELHEALDRDAGAYPREDDAVAALAGRHGREVAEVVPTNGATEALWLLPAALRPRLAACVHPAFTESEAALRAHGVPVARALRDPERGFALDPAAVPAEADLVVVGNPGSPAGTLDPAPALAALRRPGRVVVVDEAFMDLVPGEPGSLAGERLPDVIVVRSATKWLAIPGLRAGYALAPPALAARLRAVRPPWSASAPALAALASGARRPAAVAAAAERARRERSDLERRLGALAGVRLWPGAANFCLVEVADGPQALERLRQRGIAVRPCGDFPGLGPGHLRITARGPAENARVAEALAA